MAIDTGSMLMKLNPLSAISAPRGMGGGGDREQLRLMRERFEYEKQRNAELDEQARLEAAAKAAAAAAEAEEKKAAVLLAQQQAAMTKVGELAGTGKVQQAEAQAPYFDMLGIDMNTLGSVGGLPVFQFQNRAQEAERAANALPPPGLDETAEQSLARLESGDVGYPTNERGNLDDLPREASSPTGSVIELARGEPAIDAAVTDAITPGEGDVGYVPSEYEPPGAGAYGSMEEGAGFDRPEEAPAEVVVQAGAGIMPASLSTGDAYAQALAASQYARVHDKPIRGADEEDYMGAVPRNVIDLPAMQAQTLQRLNPALKAQIEALPVELQAAAKANAEAIGGLGLEATDATKEMRDAMDDPVSIYNSQQNLLAQKEKGNELNRMQNAQMREGGAKMLKDLYDERGIDKSINSINKAAEVRKALENDVLEDDSMVANAVMEAQNLKGAPSNTDLEFAFNIPKGSLLTQGLAIIQEAIRGGMSDAQKKAVLSYMKGVEEAQRQNIDEFMDNAFDTIDSDDTLDPETRKGFRSRLERSVPGHMYNDYWRRRDERDKAAGRPPRAADAGAASQAPKGEAQAELARQAETANLNGGVLAKLMGGESGGKTAAANDKSSAKGVFQLLDETAQALGLADAAEYAAQPLEKQIEYGLKLFRGKGITKDSPPEDYALVLAAPSLVGQWKTRDDVVYKKGSDEWNVNAPWRPADGGDITVGSLTDYYLKGKPPAEAKPAEAKPAETKAAAPAAQTKGAASGGPVPQTETQRRIVELLKKRG